MKMKKIFTCLAMLLCTGYAMAQGTAEDQLIIEDVTVPQGGWVYLPVKFTFADVTPTKVGFTFQFEFPEGISTVKGNDGFPVVVKDKCMKALVDQNAFLDPAQNIIFYFSSTGSIQGTEGTLLKLQLTTDASLAQGTTHVVKVLKPTFTIKKGDGTTGDIQLNDFSFNVTIGAPETRTILDENATAAPAGTGRNKVDVRVIRTINANTWSTICLPFDMSADQLSSAFGEDVLLGDFNGIEYLPEDPALPVEEIVVKFNSATSIVKHHPYIIKVSKPVEVFTVDQVQIGTNAAPVATVDEEQFVGTYIAGTIIPDGDLFLSGGDFYYSAGLNDTKGFRGYFHFQDQVVDKSAAARIGLNIDGETTYIDNLGREINDGVYYDLQGRRVNNPGKGVYIQNGKKILVK